MRVPKRQTTRPARLWGRGPGSVTFLLVAINVVCFAAQTAAEYFHPGWVEQWLALSASGLRSLHAWQLISYMFLHANLIHLLVNMMMLHFAGRQVEAIAGPRHLLGIYFAGGLLGGIVQTALTSSYAPLVGASAGVCALLIAFTTILPEIELTALIFFILPIRLRAKYFALAIVVSSLVSWIWDLLPGVGHLAHLGGCLVGWLYTHQLGYGNPWRLQRYVFDRRQRAQRYERMPPAQFISQEIDPILDKIANEGIHSLTATERRILEKGRDKIARKTSTRLG
jgi:membrane associated rhomboid family serine protease